MAAYGKIRCCPLPLEKILPTLISSILMLLLPHTTCHMLTCYRLHSRIQL